MKTRVLSCLLVAYLTPAIAMASIDGVSVNPSPVKAGEEVFITITGDARQIRCGLDGSRWSHVSVGGSKLPDNTLNIAANGT